MKIAIYSRLQKEQSIQCAISFLEKIAKKNTITAVLETSFFEKTNTHLPKNQYDTFSVLDDSYDAFISIGGDGTILRAITFIKDLNIPIVGINTGRLGFLATVQEDELDYAISNLEAKNYTISERTLLSVSTSEPHKDIDALNFALNEVTVSRKNTASMITINTHLNNEYLTSYWSDGLILSTPTGSTGYSLSCGGPVIMPNTTSFVITPIAPHNLNARPLVIDDSTVITLKVDGREDQHLISLDSRIATLDNNTEITIKKAPFTIKLIEFHNESFLGTLRKKLLWGADKRN